MARDDRLLQAPERRSLADLVRSTPISSSAFWKGENGNEVGVETGQRCAWIGNEMVPIRYPVQNGTSLQSGKSINNPLI